MKSIRTILILTLIATCHIGQGQSIDSAQQDLKNLSDIDFFRKYSFDDQTLSKDDIKVTKLIWSLSQLRTIDKGLRQQGVRTLTRIDARPSGKSQYYIIGHYQLPTPDHLARISFYRVDMKNKTIDYQSLDDFIGDKWKRLE
ncbi:MAG: hypothetical protein DI539_21050 [Flavobacterium psychrophilum]|jgi:hypothetical protein|nr:MAG: hypothetical protein DI539_21050 [Flavobacterium psychrophilum]